MQTLFISVIILVILTITNKNEKEIKEHIKDEFLELAIDTEEWGNINLWQKWEFNDYFINMIDYVDVDNFLIFSIIKYEKYVPFDIQIFTNKKPEYNIIGFSLLGMVNYKRDKIIDRIQADKKL